MIELRLKTVESDVDFKKFDIIKGETLYKALCRTLTDVPLGDREASDVFASIVNGHEVDKDLWDYVTLKEEDVVLIVPRISDGEGQNFLRTALIIAATIALGYFAGPAGLALEAGQASVFVALGTIAATMALYAIIPPPVPGFGGIAGAADISDSQMYSVNGHSNQVRRYGTVPKVYGTHRMFPSVAANPYTEIEATPEGTLVQYLYIVYDFGLGPAVVNVNDIKIGDTLLSEFEDVQTNLVDPNRPNISEGEWDNLVLKDFKLYKNSVETLQVGVTLNDNRADGGPSIGWEVVRTAPANPLGLIQEISIDFANPGGLFAFSALGDIVPRTIEIEIYFAKVGTDTWYAANDYNWVSDYTESGGFEQYSEKSLSLFPVHPGALPDFPYYSPLYSLNKAVTLSATDAEIGSAILSDVMGRRFWANRKVYGYQAGQPPYVIALSDPDIIVGRTLKVTSNFSTNIPGISQKVKTTRLGTITSIAPTGFAGYVNYILNYGAPFEQSWPLFAEYNGNLDSSPPIAISRVDGPTGAVSVDGGIGGKGKISRATRQQTFTTFKFTPKEIGEYKIRITRVNTTSQYTAQTQDSLVVQTISVRRNTPAIKTDKRHVFLEMKIRATNQLNGVVSTLSGTVTSIVPFWNGTAWERQAPSETNLKNNNPAWVFADMLTGQANKRAIPQSKLHIPSLVEWANFCDAIPTAPSNHTFTKPRFECNFVLDYDSTLQNVLGQVANAAQASLNIVDGKYGVLIDKLKTVPVQIFTPRNSSNFTSTRIYTKKPDAVKVKYIDSGEQYIVSELVVYDDGFDVNNAVVIDEITSFACTNSEQAWRFGRYVLAQNRLRQDTISIQTDFEYLVCTRGDYVKIVQDVMKVGGSPARVKSITSNRIVIDDGLSLPPGSYGYAFRSSIGTISQGTLAIVSSDTFDLTGTLPAKGDLIIIGLVGQLTYDCLVKSITPGDNLTAQLVLIEKADAVYSAESLNTFPVYDPKLNKIFDPNLTAPGAVTTLITTTNSWRCDGGKYQYYIGLDWDTPTDSTYEIFYIYANNGTGYNKVGETRDSFFEYIVDQSFLDVEHSFKVVAVAPNGKKLDLGSVPTVSATPPTKTAPPSSVEGLHVDITGEVLQLSWPKVSDCDIEEYQLRYSPDLLTATWSKSIPLLRVNGNVNLASVQARTGTYLIKAVDYNGTQSLTVAEAITTIPNLFNLNIISETTDFPSLLGLKDQVVNLDGDLILGTKVPGPTGVFEHYSTGYYYYKNFLDLGDVFVVRLQSRIQALGFSGADLMSDWTTLSSVDFMSHSNTSEWDVESQYRSSKEIDVIADWTPLSSVSFMSGGSDHPFTPWRTFKMGDFTGRVFQFRLKLSSFKASVTPRVFDGEIRADMPDRDDRYDDIAAPNTGYTLVYSPAFKGPGTTPNIQITIQNAAAGDYPVFDHKNLSEFKVTFYNSSNVAVARTFSARVKGFGHKSTDII